MGDMTSTERALDSVRTAPTILEGLSRGRNVALAAGADEPAAALVALREAVADQSDGVTAIAAVHALAAVPDPGAVAALTVLLGPDAAPHLREHAALALRSIPPHAAAVAALTALAAGGGFSGMIAEFTLEGWRRGTGSEGLLGGAAGDGPGPPLRPEPGTRPLTVAQLYLHADIDGTLAHAGQGDTGGIATLLVHLGDALLAEHGVVERVVTLSRGAGLPPATALAEPGHHFLPVPLPGRHRNVAEAWPLRVVARAGIRAQLEAAAPVDVLHLRMADVGSWAAAEVAADLGIPVVLTMAPDPHAQVAAREAAGDLTRATFGAADHAEHLTFRIRLLRELAERAAHVVVFPRPNLEEDLRTLLGIDLEERPHRVSVVPEGIDLTPLLRAVAELAGGTPSPAAAATLAGLDALLEALPPARRALPLAITVGRLHPVKGMATLVAAWRGDPALRERCNLLVVGGELEDPSDEEAGQLALIDAVVPRVEGPAAGLLLAGHRPNDTVAAWLAATRFGRPGLAAPGGVYVSASLKEEFGIAILEAMACGLVAVAPAAGGPATYVDEGVAGVLADTSSAAELARAVGAALDLSSGPGGREAAARAEATVRERFGIGTMAAALARVYREVAS